MLECGEPGIERRAFFIGAVNFIEAGRDQVSTVLLDKFHKRLGVKLASGHPQTSRKLLGGAKNPIGDGDGGFHTISITLVIPESTRCFSTGLLRDCPQL